MRLDTGNLPTGGVAVYWLQIFQAERIVYVVLYDTLSLGVPRKLRRLLSDLPELKLELSSQLPSDGMAELLLKRRLKVKWCSNGV